jgi:8-amino-7-oxononanoate synthase
MSALLGELAERLETLDDAGLRRSLTLPAGRDFASNDYLGLAADPGFADACAARLRSLDAAAPAARLLRGTSAAHLALERRFARFKGAEAALLYPSGWQANVGLLAAVIGPADRALSDERNHASLIDGLRLARCAKVVMPHGDLEAYGEALRRPWPGRTFVVTESYFSMDGSVAPLAGLADLAAAHGAELIVDDAHATGVFGARGAGLVEELGIEGRCLAVISTGGKALAASGGLIAGAAVLIDYLVNVSRAFVFTTAVPSAVLAALDVALDHVEAEPQRRQRVLAAAGELREALGRRGIHCPGVGPIVPVMLGTNQRALDVASACQRAGFDVRAVRPPTVAPGQARLRVSIHADHQPAELEALAATIADAVERLP